MLRHRSVSLIHQALHLGLQQSVQQPCIQLEVLGLQAVRNKHSMPKHRNRGTNASKNQQRRDRALDRAMAVIKQQLGGFEATEGAISGQAAAGAAASTNSSSGSGTKHGSPPPPGTPASSSPLVSASSAASSSSPPRSNTNSSSSSSSDSTGSSKSWAPSFLRKLFDSPARRPSAQAAKAGTTSPLTHAEPSGAEEASNTASKGQGGDGWDDLDKWKDLSLDEYVQLVRNDPDAEDFQAPPRPRTPMRGGHAFYQSAFDQNRVKYLRYEQHVNFITTLDPEDKLKLKVDPDVLKDEEFVKYLCDKSQFPRDIVTDTMNCYQRRKDFIAVLCEYRQAGNTMPATSDMAAQERLYEQLKKKKQQDKIKELLAERDAANCKLRMHSLLAVPGHKNRTCPQTLLPYTDCCGALAAGKKHKRRAHA